MKHIRILILSVLDALAWIGSAINRQDSTTALNTALDDTDPFFQARALRAVSEIKRYDLLPKLKQKINSDNSACEFCSGVVSNFLKQLMYILQINLKMHLMM